MNHSYTLPVDGVIRARRTRLRALLVILLVLSGGLSPTRVGALEVGVTSPLDEVYFETPFDFDGQMSDTAYMFTARNEYEAVQLVLFPNAFTPSVRVEPGPLLRVGGSDQIPEDSVDVRVVGYVNQLTARFAGNRVGWLPDPLLPDQPLNLAPGVPQCYLVILHTPANAVPGTYAGWIRVRSGGQVVDSLMWRVEVWNFTLPDHPSLKTTSLSFRDDVDDMWPGAIHSEVQRDTLVLRFAEVGFRNRLPPTGAIANGLDSWTYPDSGYTRYGYPTHNGEQFDSVRAGRMIDFMLARGAGMFLIAYTFDIFSDCCDTTERRDNLVKYLRDYRDYLAGRGLLDRAYVYNIDEPWGEGVTHAKRIYELIKTEVGPDLKVMQNTNQNNSSIIGQLIGYFDVLNINLGHYYINNVDGYRLQNPVPLAELWWNVNIWPDSHPNLLLEYPLMDARIMGPMSYRFNIQGFEYWNIKSQWSVGNYHPIDSTDLRVQWNVNNRSLDGCLVYAGTRFEVFSSLRYESLRDGMEDYEYLKLLQASHPGHPLLNVGIITGLSTFTQDPAELEQFRRQVGDLLSSTATSVDETRSSVPRAFELLGNYPNPFNGGTRIAFDLAAPAHVQLQVYDVLGRLWAVPVRAWLPAGRHEVSWDGGGRDGETAPSGVYFYTLHCGDSEDSGRMMLLR